MSVKEIEALFVTEAQSQLTQCEAPLRNLETEAEGLPLPASLREKQESLRLLGRRFLGLFAPLRDALNTLQDKARKQQGEVNSEINSTEWRITVLRFTRPIRNLRNFVASGSEQASIRNSSSQSKNPVPWQTKLWRLITFNRED